MFRLYNIGIRVWIIRDEDLAMVMLTCDLVFVRKTLDSHCKFGGRKPKCVRVSICWKRKTIEIW